MIGLLRWGAALLAVVLLFVFAIPRIGDQLSGSVEMDFDGFGGTSEDDGGEDDGAEGEVQRGEVVAERHQALFGTTAAQAEEDIVAIGGEGADALLLDFPALPVEAACLTEVVLEIEVRQTTATQLAVQRAQLVGLADIEDGQELAEGGGATGESAEVDIESADATASGDITEVYRSAAEDAAEDAGGETDGDAGGETDDRPVVLALTVPEEDDRFAFLVTSAGAEEERPRLRWAATQGCEGGESTEGGERTEA